MVMTTAREENSEFCVAVAPVTRTAGSWLKALAVKLMVSHPADLGHILA